MTLKDKAKTYNFWISIVSAAVLIARIVGDKFNIFIDTTLIMDITTGLCSIFVILGILSAPKTIASDQTISKNNNSNLKNNQTFLTENKLIDNALSDNQKQDTTTEIKDESNTETNNISSITIDVSSAVNKPEKTDFNLIEIIETLKADINKANQIIENNSKNND